MIRDLFDRCLAGGQGPVAWVSPFGCRCGRVRDGARSVPRTRRPLQRGPACARGAGEVAHAMAYYRAHLGDKRLRTGDSADPRGPRVPRVVVATKQLARPDALGGGDGDVDGGCVRGQGDRASAASAREPAGDSRPRNRHSRFPRGTRRAPRPSCSRSPTWCGTDAARASALRGFGCRGGGHHRARGRVAALPGLPLCDRCSRGRVPRPRDARASSWRRRGGSTSGNGDSRVGARLSGA